MRAAAAQRGLDGSGAVDQTAVEAACCSPSGREVPAR